MKIGYAQNTVTPPLDRPVYPADVGNNRLATIIHDDKATLVLTGISQE
jgi:hypothetical protein